MGEQKREPNHYDKDRVTASTVRFEDKIGPSLLLLLRRRHRNWGAAKRHQVVLVMHVTENPTAGEE